jgi:hypothetical protein
VLGPGKRVGQAGARGKLSITIGSASLEAFAGLAVPRKASDMVVAA